MYFHVFDTHTNLSAIVAFCARHDLKVVVGASDPKTPGVCGSVIKLFYSEGGEREARDVVVALEYEVGLPVLYSSHPGTRMNPMASKDGRDKITYPLDRLIFEFI